MILQACQRLVIQSGATGNKHSTQPLWTCGCLPAWELANNNVLDHRPSWKPFHGLACIPRIDAAQRHERPSLALEASLSVLLLKSKTTIATQDTAKRLIKESLSPTISNITSQASAIEHQMKVDARHCGLEAHSRMQLTRNSHAVQLACSCSTKRRKSSPRPCTSGFACKWRQTSAMRDSPSASMALAAAS